MTIKTPGGTDIIAGHAVRRDALGKIKPWAAWNDVLELEMNFYRLCPAENGYPRFVTTTFLDAAWNPLADRDDSIPATQNGMGILSYLKYQEWSGNEDLCFQHTACLMGDYLVKETLTPRSGPYPSFTRSTGHRGQFPQPADAGSQSDRPYEIEPDKGGIAGYALLLLFEATGARQYLTQALQNAQVLAANQQAGDAHQSPWPFRVDLRGGEARGPVSGNMSYIMRLYDGLIAQGYGEFEVPRRSLCAWIKNHQIPSAATNGALFAQFFEDHDTPTNRTAWAPLNLARYVLDRQTQFDPEWRAQAATLVDFVRRTFTHTEFDITLCHEQDEDQNAWGGINATYGAVLAQLAQVIGSPAMAEEARQALDFTLYSIDESGRPRDLHKSAAPGGWQEDAHTDVIHNYIDALRVFPQWGESR
jgi:hypothetical protein